jgi:hypothetical protein
VDERLHGGQQQRCAQAADDRPDDEDRDEVLGDRHGKGAGGVAEQAEHVGALGPDEVADLAADQDERGGDQRLERDRRLDAADGVSRSSTTALIDTFIGDVSTTSTNIASASRTASVRLPVPSAGPPAPASSLTRSAPLREPTP